LVQGQTVCTIQPFRFLEKAFRFTNAFEAIWIENFDQYQDRFPDLANKAQSANRAPAFAAVPLVAAGECHGVLAFGYLTPRAFPESDRVLVSTLAHHCAQALFRAQLLKRSEHAAHQAEEANRLKDEFLATISHELRTPLSATLGWTTLLRRAGRPDEKMLQKAIDVIERSGQSQLRIIDDMLDVSRIIRGELRIDETPLDVEPIARELSTRFDSKIHVTPAQRKQLTESQARVQSDGDHWAPPAVGRRDQAVRLVECEKVELEWGSSSQRVAGTCSIAPHSTAIASTRRKTVR
jgi:signal transduction histidine kinase